MTELDALVAASKAEADALAALKAEHAAFLADVATRLTAATPPLSGGIDPALLAPIIADINGRAAELQALTAAQQAADPVTPAVEHVVLVPPAAPAVEAAAAPAEPAPTGPLTTSSSPF